MSPQDTPFPGDDTRGDAGTVVLFADGLRFDVSQRLVERLRAKDYAVAVSMRWAALPTVTATAKPAVVSGGGAHQGPVPRRGLPPRRRRK